ncbi:hypothetical protein GCM10008967_00150 [Bacillus carboniphilus]|uniref:Transposase n=1 Tax=Bacillus carboniphilus TaxID=86663 RepID=A0ABN0VP01_9BACI
MKDQLAWQRKIIREEYLNEDPGLANNATHPVNQVLQGRKHRGKKRVVQQMGRRIPPN